MANIVNRMRYRFALEWRLHYSADCLLYSSLLNPGRQPFTLRGTVKWVPAKGRWCSAAGKVTAGLAENNGSLPPGGWLKSPAGWLPVHRDQLRGQRSVTSMGSFYLYLSLLKWLVQAIRCQLVRLKIVCNERYWWVISTRHCLLQVALDWILRQ